jgi:hypothetical protein
MLKSAAGAVLRERVANQHRRESFAADIVIRC